MHLKQLTILITALCVSPIFAKPLSESESQKIFASPKKPSPRSKAAYDIDEIVVWTSLVVGHLDRISTSGTEAPEYISPFLSKLSDLTEGVSAINEDNDSAITKPLTSNDKYELCTTAWNLIYKERNLMSYVDTLSANFIKYSASKDLRKAIDSYSRAMDQFFNVLIPRLNVCSDQLEYALEDFDTTLGTTWKNLSKTGEKTAESA
ncbi:hypothetical protein B0T10DRAFT_600769 [Thelonectria olida]|uniref:Uncharacterized protein n=1 Tax=Thelonectria olida TaxID=1576542 RepID=A0A9P9AX64_9HYPO|nr:hypothetical protein B0T10DRAFT_600769 [Thelonectria olida]